MPTPQSTEKAPEAPAVFVSSSGIHGKGLFAARDIPADTLIITIEGKPTSEDGTYVIWSEDDEGEPEGFLIENDARYVNHAREPNAAFYDLELWSLRDIAKGEELTHDYGPGWSDLG